MHTKLVIKRILTKEFFMGVVVELPIWVVSSLIQMGINRLGYNLSTLAWKHEDLNDKLKQRMNNRIPRLHKKVPYNDYV